MQEQIKIDVYNWGPCVVRLKVKDDFMDIFHETCGRYSVLFKRT